MIIITTRSPVASKVCVAVGMFDLVSELELSMQEILFDLNRCPIFKVSLSTRKQEPKFKAFKKFLV